MGKEKKESREYADIDDQSRPHQPSGVDHTFRAYVKNWNVSHPPVEPGLVTMKDEVKTIEIETERRLGKPANSLRCLALCETEKLSLSRRASCDKSAGTSH